MVVKIPTWPGPECQQKEIGNNTYDIAGVIFEASKLEPFEAPLQAMDFYHMSICDEKGDMRGFVMHMVAVLNADLTKPIILCPDGSLIDGAHRVAKALYEGRDTILTVRFSEEPQSKKRKEQGT